MRRTTRPTAAHALAPRRFAARAGVQMVICTPRFAARAAAAVRRGNASRGRCEGRAARRHAGCAAWRLEAGIGAGAVLVMVAAAFGRLSLLRLHDPRQASIAVVTGMHSYCYGRALHMMAP